MTNTNETLSAEYRARLRAALQFVEPADARASFHEVLDAYESQAERIRELEAIRDRLVEGHWTPSDSLTTLHEENVELLGKVKKLESENARLRGALEQACETAQELALTASHELRVRHDDLGALDRQMLETMRRNRKELLG